MSPRSSPATGATLQWLATLIGARAVAEVGTGAGVSGLWLLRGMTDDGVLTTVDEETENTRAARQTFTEAGVPTQRVRLITGRPLDVLSRLADAAYDLVFFDGNPQESSRYLEEALRLLRPGGLVVFDDALAGGRVADPAQRDPATIAVRTLVNDITRGRADSCRSCCLWATACWWRRSSTADRSAAHVRRMPGPAPETKPAPPSAIATTSNGS